MARLLWLDRKACKRHQEDAEAVDPYENDSLSIGIIHTASAEGGYVPPSADAGVFCSHLQI